MNGRKLLQLFADALDESASVEIFLRNRVAYECMDQAAGLFLRETHGILTAEIEITTVEDQQAYDLPPDYIKPLLRNRRGQFIARYYDGSIYSFPWMAPYETLFIDNLTEAKSRPNYFAIKDKSSKETQITGTATAAGARTGGQCILTDSTKKFTTDHQVYPRDIVMNTTDGSMGYVLSVTDATHLICALFDGQEDEFAQSDGYIIQPSTEFAMMLDAPSESAGHVLTLPYVCMPSPVFSEYGGWRIGERACRGIVAEGAALYARKDDGRKNAEKNHQVFLNEVAQYRNERAMTILRQRRR